MILLDTKAISEPVKLRPSPSALPWIAGHRPADLFLSASTLGEIDMGALLRERALQRLPRGPVRRHGVRDDRIAAAPVTTVLGKCVAIQGRTVWHETVAGMPSACATTARGRIRGEA